MRNDAPRLALIPARGGSKRLPGKNVRRFLGHPMIAYAIAAAQACRLFDRIVVSTDDPEIGRVAQWYGAEFLPRPPCFATDAASLVDVAAHALDTLRARGETFAALCQLMPNCPLRRSEDIVQHHDAFQRGRRRFQISVVPYRGVYPHWAVRRAGDGGGEWVFGEHLVPSQQLGETFCPTGAIWWVRVAEFLDQRAFYGRPFHLEPMDATRGIDIDEPEDLDLAEILAAGLQARRGVSPLEPVGRPAFREETADG